MYVCEQDNKKKAEYVDQSGGSKEGHSIDWETKKKEQQKERKREREREDKGNTFTVNLEEIVLVVCLRDVEHSFIYSYECTTINKQNNESYKYVNLGFFFSKKTILFGIIIWISFVNVICHLTNTTVIFLLSDNCPCSKCNKVEKKQSERERVTL